MVTIQAATHMRHGDLAADHGHAAARSLIVGYAVAVARPLDAREAEVTEVHTGDQQPIRSDKIQKPRPRISGEMRVLIERDRHIRARNLRIPRKSAGDSI